MVVAKEVDKGKGGRRRSTRMKVVAARIAGEKGKNKSNMSSRSRIVNVKGEDKSRSKDETELVTTIGSQVDLVEVELVEYGNGRIRDGEYLWSSNRHQ